jgi:hypothetical protein
VIRSGAIVADAVRAIELSLSKFDVKYISNHPFVVHNHSSVNASSHKSSSSHRP